MAATVRCEAPISNSKCAVPVRYNFMTEEWLHTINDAYTDHPVIVPEGTTIPKTLVDELLEKNVKQFEAAKAKYGGLVHNLTDMEFAGLYQVVMVERTERMAILIATNPVVRAAAIELVKGDK